MKRLFISCFGFLLILMLTSCNIQDYRIPESSINREKNDSQNVNAEENYESSEIYYIGIQIESLQSISSILDNYPVIEKMAIDGREIDFYAGDFNGNSDSDMSCALVEIGAGIHRLSVWSDQVSGAAECEFEISDIIGEETDPDSPYIIDFNYTLTDFGNQAELEMVDVFH